MIGLTRKVELNGSTYTARELTVIEVRNWLHSQASAEDFSVVDEMLFADYGVSSADLLLMSDITKEQLDKLPPSAMKPLADAIKEVNPDFFGMRRRLAAISTTQTQSV